jgi:hypothetical protein
METAWDEAAQGLLDPAEVGVLLEIRRAWLVLRRMLPRQASRVNEKGLQAEAHSPLKTGISDRFTSLCHGGGNRLGRCLSPRMQPRESNSDQAWKAD